MGGKSRKSGGVSKELIQRLMRDRDSGKAKPKGKSKIKKFLIEDEDEEESINKKLSKRGKKNRC